MEQPTDHRRRRPNRLAVGAATLALVLGSTACASNADDADDATSDSAIAAPVTTDAPVSDTTVAPTTSGTTAASPEMTVAGDAVVADVLTETMAGKGVDVFLSLVSIVGLDEITDVDEVTLFVPSDEAFTSIAGDEVSAIVEDPTLILEVLESHLVEGVVSSSDLSDGDTVEPISGDSLDVTIDGEAVMIGEATVTQADIQFDGGVIHIIDDVLRLPEVDFTDEGEAAAADVLTDTMAGEGVDLFLSLVGIIGLENITDADEVTLFVPTDEALTSIRGDEVATIIEDPALILEVLESHLVEGVVSISDLSDGDTVEPISGDSIEVTIAGDIVMIGEATVIKADIQFDGGVIHIIDDVLMLQGS